jgi:hypothetical protein
VQWCVQKGVQWYVLPISKWCLCNLAWVWWSSESGLVWQLGWKRTDYDSGYQV